MKKFAVVAISALLALSLVACGSAAPAESAPAESAPASSVAAESAPAESTPAVDAVTTPSTTTGLYTNLELPQLLEEIAKYSGVSVVSTVNADGTPNIAILTPGAAGDDSHIVFNLAPNATRENMLRDKVAMMAFDKPNTAAETKAERHTGAVVKLVLEEDQDVIAALAENSQFIVEGSLVFQVAEVRAVG